MCPINIVCYRLYIGKFNLELQAYEDKTKRSHSRGFHLVHHPWWADWLVFTTQCRCWEYHNKLSIHIHWNIWWYNLYIYRQIDKYALCMILPSSASSFNFNFKSNLVESWDSINFIFNTHPPTHPRRKSLKITWKAQLYLQQQLN